MDISLVIVNWNTREALRRCLASPGVAAGNHEIIVVDNASADGSAAMVREEFPHVRLIANETNRNYAAASNQALALASGQAILLLNPDTELPADAPSLLSGFLAENDGATAVAPMLVSPDGTPQRSLRGFPTPLAIFGELTGLARLFPHGSLGGYRPRDLPEEPTLVDQPMASCLLVRATALREIGGFDERFPLFFNDVDLCYRLQASGGEIWFDPSVRVRHLGGASTQQVRPAAILASHRGLRDFYRKHYRQRLGPLLILAEALIWKAGWLRAGWAWLRGAGRGTAVGTQQSTASETREAT